MPPHLAESPTLRENPRGEREVIAQGSLLLFCHSQGSTSGLSRHDISLPLCNGFLASLLAFVRLFTKLAIIGSVLFLSCDCQHVLCSLRSFNIRLLRKFFPLLFLPLFFFHLSMDHAFLVSRFKRIVLPQVARPLHVPFFQKKIQVLFRYRDFCCLTPPLLFISGDSRRCACCAVAWLG